MGSLVVMCSALQVEKSQFRRPHTKANTTKNIAVGHCDEGPVYWDYVNATNEWPLFCDKKHVPCVYVFFRSSVIEDASPPACGFSYDAHNTSKQYCNVMDSREGYHM